MPIKLNSTGGGSVTLDTPSTANNYTLTAPAATGTILTTASTTGINGSAIDSGTVAEAYGGTGTTTGYYSFKNRIINGAMMIDQRNAGASVTGTAGNIYAVDRFALYSSISSKFTAQQNAGGLTGTNVPAGFTSYLGVTSSSAYTVGSTESFRIQQPIEGYNTADLNWGTANAKTVTLSFWVRSSLTGTFGGSFVNESIDRSYPFSFVISSSNTWEQKTVTVVGDTTGTWGTTNGTGIRVYFNLGSGSSFSGTANTWQAGFYIAPTGATSVVGTNGATFYITGVQLEKGSTATSFDYRPYGTELALCQRYYERVGYVFQGASGNPMGYYKVTKRAAPTLAIIQLSGGSGGTAVISTYDSTGSFLQLNANSAAANSLIEANSEL